MLLPTMLVDQLVQLSSEGRQSWFSEVQVHFCVINCLVSLLIMNIHTNHIIIC